MGAASSVASPRLLFPRPHRLTLTGESPGTPRPEKRYNPSTWSWVYPLVLLPVGRARNTSLGKRPSGILIRCLNHLNWLLSTQRSSGSTLSPSRMAELLSLSVRETPATLQRKPISASCTPDLIHSVMNHRTHSPLE